MDRVGQPVNYEGYILEHKNGMISFVNFIDLHEENLFSSLTGSNYAPLRFKTKKHASYI